MSEQIFSLACTLCTCDESRQQLLRSLCTVAASHLRSRLREEITPEDCADAFACAAACYAVSLLLTLHPAACSSLSSLRAGDITIACNDLPVHEQAALLRKQSYDLLSSCLRDETFFFRGVVG